MMKDFLGNEYGEGDLVIYGASGGRSINMIIGRVVSVKQRTTRDGTYDDAGKYRYTQVPVTDKDGNPVYSVRIQPLHSSRWEQHDPRTYYVDTRTGKTVDRYSHVKEQSYYTDARTGERLPADCGEYYRYVKTRKTWYSEDHYDMVPEKNPAYIPSECRTYHQTVFEDYIEERQEGPKPVTITVTENIVKWSGELPDVP
jgi:hypothetical protein